MIRSKIYIYTALLLVVLCLIAVTNTKGKNEPFPEQVKISLREVGHNLLLSKGDSTSLILPVVSSENSKYQLSFEKDISFDPGLLVTSVKESFDKTKLPSHYIVEVIQCSDGEVAYSYEIKNDTEKDLVPCSGRTLPESCYTIEVYFSKLQTSVLSRELLLYTLLFIVLIFLLDYFVLTKKTAPMPVNADSAYSSIGSFRFYPKQNKLVKEPNEISLSRKECELLEIFVANPNQIITRDELTKKVWEDNGVFVGRSLDTYISKLRKKLQDDDSIKLTNIHGVGYKLEIEV